MFERGSLTLFRVRGVPIRAHWTLLLVLPYLAIVLALGFKQLAATAGVGEGRLILPPLAWGAILALGLFASVAVHELAHSLLALRFGGRVRSISLMLLGGVSQVTRVPHRPRYEALMALAGPLTSLAIGGLLLLLLAVTPPSWPGDARMALFYLTYMNVMLGLFNLLPAFPLDGGRVLRALLAARLGRERATGIAATVGRAAGVGLATAALLGGNILLLLIAAFIFFGAGAEVMNERVREALHGLRAIDLVPRFHGLRAALPAGTPHVVVRWDAPAGDVLDAASEANAPFVVVVDEDREVLGVLATTDIERAIAMRLAQAPRRASWTSSPRPG